MGVDAVKKHSRSLLFALLIPGILLLSAFAIIGAAQQTNSTAVKGGRWSDGATWSDKKVPGKDAAVTIGKDMNVVLDVTPPALRSLTIEGKLSFADDKDLELTTEWVMVHGELEIGTEAKPHTRKATITLTDNVKDEDFGGMGGNDKSDRGIMLMGGTLNLHGVTKNTWTKLSATAAAGSTSIQVLNAAGWKVGEEIVLASTDFNPRQAERRTISAINGNTITLDKKLDYMHFGKITFDVDERGEVGLLTRNIKIQASADAEQSFFGGHVMAMSASKMFVEGVEFNRMGQNLTLARYPIHWHLIGDAQGQYVKNAAFHDTYNRCVTVHGTNFLHVENNVTYNTSVTASSSKMASSTATSLSTTWRFRPSAIPASPASRPPSAHPEKALPERMASNPRTYCCPRTTRWRLTGSPIRTTRTGTTLPRVPTRTASGCPCRSTRTVNLQTRKSVKIPGHAT
jgi:cell migration-inducing and hyaluronan-binding protein